MKNHATETFLRLIHMYLRACVSETMTTD